MTEPSAGGIQSSHRSTFIQVFNRYLMPGGALTAWLGLGYTILKSRRDFSSVRL